MQTCHVVQVDHSIQYTHYMSLCGKQIIQIVRSNLDVIDDYKEEEKDHYYVDSIVQLTIWPVDSSVEDDHK